MLFNARQIKRRLRYDQIGTRCQLHQQTIDRTKDFLGCEDQSKSAEKAAYQDVNPEDFSNVLGTDSSNSDFSKKLCGKPTRQQRQSRRGNDLEHSVELTLKEAFHGTTVLLEWENGPTVNAKIPPGIQHGTHLRLKGQGGVESSDGQRGDLFLAISIAVDDRLQRDNDDLNTTVQIDLFTMLLGGKFSVAGVDRSVKLDIPSGTSNGCIFRLKGLGMPNRKRPLRFGDLYVKVETILPQNLTAEEKDLVEHWRHIHSRCDRYSTPLSICRTTTGHI